MVASIDDENGAGSPASQLADRLFTAIERGDVDAVRALYHPDAVVWHNTDGVGQEAEDNLATLRWMATNLTDVRYTQIRRSDTTDGFVQRHVLIATNRAGRRVAAAACIVATLRDGLASGSTSTSTRRPSRRC